MNEKQVIIAKALEIAVTLTKTEDAVIRVDKDKNVFISTHLYENLEGVIRIINAGNISHIFDNSGGFIYPDRKLNS